MSMHVCPHCGHMSPIRASFVDPGTREIYETAHAIVRAIEEFPEDARTEAKWGHSGCISTFWIDGHGFDGWRVGVFVDCDGFDYVDSITRPDGTALFEPDEFFDYRPATDEIEARWKATMVAK